MPDWIEEMKSAAEKARHREWKARKAVSGARYLYDGDEMIGDIGRASDLEHIATSSPANILKLVEAYESAVSTLRMIEKTQDSGVDDFGLMTHQSLARIELIKHGGPDV